MWSRWTSMIKGVNNIFSIWDLGASKSPTSLHRLQCLGECCNTVFAVTLQKCLADYETPPDFPLAFGCVEKDWIFPLRATRHICGKKNTSPQWFWLLPAACRILHKAAPTAYSWSQITHDRLCCPVENLLHFLFPVHSLRLSIHANVSRSTLSKWFAGSVCWASQSPRYLRCHGQTNCFQVFRLSLWLLVPFWIRITIVCGSEVTVPASVFVCPHSGAFPEQYEATACIHTTHTHVQLSSSCSLYVHYWDNRCVLMFSNFNLSRSDKKQQHRNITFFFF